MEETPKYLLSSLHLLKFLLLSHVHYPKAALGRYYSISYVTIDAMGAVGVAIVISKLYLMVLSF